MHDPVLPVALVVIAARAAMIVLVHAEIDLATTAPILAALLRTVALLPPPDVLILDLTTVGFFSAAAVHMIDEFTVHCAGRGIQPRLIVAPGGVVQRVVRLAGLDARVPVFTALHLALPASV